MAGQTPFDSLNSKQQEDVRMPFDIEASYTGNFIRTDFFPFSNETKKIVENLKF